MAESWAMQSVVAEHLPTQILVGVLVKSLTGLSPGTPPQSAEAGATSASEDEAERDEQILKMYSR
nr:MAG TPA: hypothetical protein [Caudoviricetes sp.]